MLIFVLFAFVLMIAISSKHDRPALLAFLVTPLVPAVGLTVATPISPPHDIDEVLLVLGWIFVLYLWTVLPTAIFGLPAYLLGRRLGLIRWWSCLIAGLGIGVFVSVLMDLNTGNLAASAFQYNARGHAIFAALGLIAGLVFWLIWYWRRRPEPEPSRRF